MTNALDDLATREWNLLAQIPPTGHFEERGPLVEAAGLPGQWAEIIDKYLELLDDPVFRLEALRRAVFLVWYGWNEPWQLTGIRDVNPATEREVLWSIESELRLASPDLELRSMLSGYGRGLPFDQHPDLSATATFLESATGRCYPDVRFESLERRGAMGRYWLSRNDLPDIGLHPTALGANVRRRG